MSLYSTFLLAAISVLGLSKASVIPETHRTIQLYRDLSIRRETGEVDVDRLHEHVAYAEGRIQRGLDTFEANTGAPHPLAQAASGARKRGATTVDLKDLDGMFYYGSIEVGTPRVEYIVIFDTVGGDLILLDELCSSQSCDRPTKYSFLRSSTSEPLEHYFRIKFGDGSISSGQFHRDTVSINGLTAAGQAIESVTEVLGLFPGSKDGLLGLAFSKISSFKSNSVIQALFQQEKTDFPVFALKLGPRDASLIIGGWDKFAYRGSFTSVPVTVEAFWQITMDGVKVGGKKVLGETAVILDICMVPVDAPALDAAIFYHSVLGAAEVIGSGFYTFPCNAVPDVSFTFSGKDFKISAATFNLGTVPLHSSLCFGGIKAQTTTLRAGWVLGYVFLSNVYTLFDLTPRESRVAFADLA